MDNIVEEFKKDIVLPNEKGPKKSFVKILVTLTKGGFNNIWSWKAKVSVDRNDRNFCHKDNIVPDDKFKLLDHLFAIVEEEIKLTYGEGCNVDGEEIVNFVEQCKNEFYEKIKSANT